ncbi:metallophosphoesterase [Bhargavaea ullalensis]|uniref:Phosphoesterase n=1 Tax=Bhargavaea ullalensis TaxID=1265685 RepID=A0ABV2G8J7_9BACL
MGWRLAVLSDTHGSREAVRQFREREQSSSDALIHCGDSEFTADDPDMKGFLAVQGNCDPPGAFADRLTTEAGGLRVLVVHGHLEDVKSGMLRLRYRAAETGADMVLFGHTHMYGAEEAGGVLYVNPGSPRLPWPGNPPTYATVEGGEEGVTVRFMRPDGSEAEAKNFPHFRGSR